MDDRAALALIASLIAGLSTGVGALPVLFVRSLSATWGIVVGFLLMTALDRLLG